MVKIITTRMMSYKLLTINITTIMAFKTVTTGIARTPDYKIIETPTAIGLIRNRRIMVGECIRAKLFDSL